MTFGEGLDDHHGCTATGTRAGIFGWGVLCDILSGGEGYGNERGYRSGEQLPSPCQVLDACGIGQQAVMADAVETRYALQHIKGLMWSSGLCGVASREPAQVAEPAPRTPHN